MGDNQPRQQQPTLNVFDEDNHPTPLNRDSSERERRPGGHLRLHSDRLFDTDDLQPALPSPPYKKVASSSNLAHEYDDQQTPPYRSNQNLPLMSDSEYDEKAAARGDDKRRQSDEQRREHEHGDGHRPKPSVHYPSEMPAPTYRTMSGNGSSTIEEENLFRPIHSRQSSYATDDGSDDDDEFDWSAEEDLADEEAKFQQQMGTRTRARGWFRKLLSLLFGSLIGSVLLAGIIVTPPLLLYFYWYKPNPTEHRRYVIDNVEAWCFWAAANVVISWWLALFVDIVPIVGRFAVAAVWGHVSETTKTRIELYNSVKGNIKPVFYAASGWVSWNIIFENIYDLHTDEDVTSRASYTDRVGQVVEFFFFLALVWCIQRMASHAIAFAFHRVAFKERIDELTTALRSIERLRDYRPKKHRRGQRSSRTPLAAFLTPGASTPGHEKGFNWNRSRAASPAGTASESEWEGDAEAEGGNGSYGKKKGKGKRSSRVMSDSPVRAMSPGSGEGPSEGSSSPHRYPPPPSATFPPNGKRGAGGDESDSSSDDAAAIATKAAKAVKNAVLHDARNIQGKDHAEGNGMAWDVSTTSEAKRLARVIFHSFRDGRRNYLLEEDFRPAFATEEEARVAFRVFDKDNNGDISRPEIKSTLIKTYKERRFLSRSIRDVSAALHTLDRILLIFAAIILFFIALPVFGVDITNSLTSFYSIGIAASFIFKNSAANMFDAIMFLFVTHPFDTGDRCAIGTENLVVKKMGLFATVFARADGTETYYFNSQLFNMFITNWRRSDKTAETVSLQVAWRTPVEKLQALEDAMNDWLQHEENRWFQPSTSIVYQNISYQRYLEVTLGVSHNGNWQDWGLRLTRKTVFYAAVQHFCRQLGIKTYNTVQPVRWVREGDPSSWDAAYADESPVPGSLEMPGSPMMEAQPGGGERYAAPSGTEGAVGGTATTGDTEHVHLGPTAKSSSQTPAQKTSWLGFTPRDETTNVRARKSSKKIRGIDGTI